MSELSTQDDTQKIFDGAVQLFRRSEGGNWYARFSINGQQLKKSLNTRDLKEAKEQARRAYAEALGRVEVGKSLTKTSFRSVAMDFLTYYKGLVTRGEKLDDDYKFNVKGKCERFFIPYFGDMAIDQITTRHIDKFLDWRRSYWIDGPGKQKGYVEYERKGEKVVRTAKHGLPSVAALNRELGVLRLIFKHAAKEGWIEPNRIPEINYARGKGARRASFERFEIERLIAYLDERVLEPDLKQGERRERIMFRAFVSMAAFTGMRPIEIDNLCWKDVVGFKGGKSFEFIKLRDRPIGEYDVRIYVRGKGKERRIIPLKSIAPTFLLLWDLWEDERKKPPTPTDPILFTKDGKRRERPGPILARTLKRLGILHDHEGRARCFTSFRHFYISELLMAGNSIHDVAKNAGTSIQMIERHYGHIDLERNAERLQSI